MAVPSSGIITMIGIFSEKNENDYSAFETEGEVDFSLRGLSTDAHDDSLSMGQCGDLNTLNLSSNRPDENAPHAMSEFYSYDHDKTLATFSGKLIEDWNDGDVGTGTREHFDTTSTGQAGNSTGIAPQSEAQPGNDTQSKTVTTRMAWSTNGSAGNTSNTLRLTNTNSTNGSNCRAVATQFSGNFPSTSTNVSGFDIEIIFGFKMTSSNNKDAHWIFYADTNTSNGDIGYDTYHVSIADNADSNPGKMTFKRRDNGTITTLSSQNSAYTLGNSSEIKMLRASAKNSWRVYVDGSQKITQSDSNYTHFARWGFYAPRFMSTPSSTHYHQYDYFSVRGD